MPVYTTAIAYDRTLPRWTRVRHAVSGQWAVQGAGETYLPRLGGMTEADYERYKLGAKWYGATTQTVAMLTGMIQRKPPTIDLPPLLENMAEDADLRGTPLAIFISSIVNEVIQVGRVGLLVDINGQQSRPYLSLYRADDMINWAEDSGQSARDQLSMVVLREVFTEQSAEDEFVRTARVRYRVLDMDANRSRQRKFIETDTGFEKEGEDIFPVFRGRSLDSIPFFFVGSAGMDSDIGAIPMEGLASLNFHHYLLAADYFHGCHFTALPQPWASGFDTDEQREHIPTTIGPSSIWGLPTGGQAGLLEYSGNGLAELREAMEQDKREMADVGARILQTQSRSGEAARTVELKQSAETALLASISTTCSHALTQALRTCAEWVGANPDDAKCELNTDFIPTELDPSLLRELIAAVQAGEISRAEFFDQLKQGELVAANKTFDEHLAELDEDQAARGGGFGMPDTVSLANAQAGQ